MELSVKNLAARLDALDASGAFITEGELSVTVSGLGVAAAHEIGSLCAALGWIFEVEDNAGTRWALDALDVDFAPFRLTFDKPAGPIGSLRLLTDAGFGAWLEKDDGRASWQIGGLASAFRTYAIEFTPWTDTPIIAQVDDNPREARGLVRENAGHRLVPASLSRWLLADPDIFPEDDQTANVWAARAARKLMLTLPDEVDAEAQRFRFKGPPRLDLQFPAPDSDLVSVFGRTGFLQLQAAIDWVFEIPREAEMRHILLAAEIARSGGIGEDAGTFLKENISDALAGAKLAYQIQLAGISSDALKTLGELRKAVSDDTAKAADGTRQIITAIAGALAVSAGLVAARLTGNVNTNLVKIVMALAATYVTITILSGVLFTLLQRSVRKAWQPRLYRFLPEADYRSLVGRPAKVAEAALWMSAAVGSLAVVLMVLAITKIQPEAEQKLEPPQKQEKTKVRRRAAPEAAQSTVLENTSEPSNAAR